MGGVLPRLCFRGMTTDHDLVDLYDREILEIEKVLNDLKRWETKKMVLEDFVKEAEEKFAAIGFRVNVNVFASDQNNTYIPEIEIVGRMKPLGEFDHEEKRHEVVNDLLDLGEGGTVPFKLPKKLY